MWPFMILTQIMAFLSEPPIHGRLLPPCLLEVLLSTLAPQPHLLELSDAHRRKLVRKSRLTSLGFSLPSLGGPIILHWLVISLTLPNRFLKIYLCLAFLVILSRRMGLTFQFSYNWKQHRASDHIGRTHKQERRQGEHLPAESDTSSDSAWLVHTSVLLLSH